MPHKLRLSCTLTFTLFALLIFWNLLNNLDNRHTPLAHFDVDDVPDEVDSYYNSSYFLNELNYKFVAIPQSNQFIRTRNSLPEDNEGEDDKATSSSVHSNVHKNAKVHDTTENKNLTFPPSDSIDMDPSIDDNALPESYKWYLNKNPPNWKCDSPTHNVAHVKVHRTGSHTLANILYRYTELNNLTAGLPVASSYQFYWPLRFHHSFVDKTLILDRINIMANVARNKKTNLDAMMGRDVASFLTQPIAPLKQTQSNSKEQGAAGPLRITMLRHPVSHFESVFAYSDIPFMLQNLGIVNANASDYRQKAFNAFLADPKQMLKVLWNHTVLKHDPHTYLLQNGQLFDLGFDAEDYADATKMKWVERELALQIDLVLIFEHWYESLVLLKRTLCWQITDLVHLAQRVRKDVFRNQVSPKQKDAILELSAADMRVYSAANNSFWRMVNAQDQQDFWSDVELLKQWSARIERECVDKRAEELENQQQTKGNSANSKERDISKRVVIKEDIQDREMEYLCARLGLQERDYVRILKLNQLDTINLRDKQMREKLFNISANVIEEGSNRDISHLFLYEKPAEANITSSTNLTSVSEGETDRQAYGLVSEAMVEVDENSAKLLGNL